jgi:TPR repeat protein
MRKLFLIVMMLASLGAISQNNVSHQIDSLLQLATRYSGGPERNDSLAFAKFIQCAQLGHARSMNTVGLMYKRGRGVQANGNEAAIWFERAGNAGYTQGWYNLGLHYKGMRPPSQDFVKAYENFSRGTTEGDSLCVFLKGYMLYKGFGCNQDYAQASVLFQVAANKGVSNSMYFLGLCFRNGYGLDANADSAQYWLQLAARRMNRQAIMELESEEPENGNAQARGMARQVLDASAKSLYPQLNKYQKIETSIPEGVITGKYNGHLIKYDWSGQNIIGVSSLTLELYSLKGTVYGTWIENDNLKVQLTAKINSSNIEFLNTSYSRTDHYSPDKAIKYNFEEASLQWVQKGDTVSLAGNIQLFSPVRNEPHKPLSIVLIKIGKEVSRELISFSNISEGLDKPDKLMIYPNPFKNVFTVEFALEEKYEVSTELMTIDGKVIYSNKAGKLDAGFYTLSLSPANQLLPGIYLVVLRYGSKTKTAKVIKE